MRNSIAVFYLISGAGFLHPRWMYTVVRSTGSRLYNVSRTGILQYAIVISRLWLETLKPVLSHNMPDEGGSKVENNNRSSTIMVKGKPKSGRIWKEQHAR